MDNEEIRELLKELKETSDESTAVRSRVVKIHFDTRQEAERRAREREKAREEAERQREKEEQEEKERQEALSRKAEEQTEAIVSEAKAEASAAFSPDLSTDMEKLEEKKPEETQPEETDLKLHWGIARLPKRGETSVREAAQRRQPPKENVSSEETAEEDENPEEENPKEISEQDPLPRRLAERIRGGFGSLIQRLSREDENQDQEGVQEGSKEKRRWNDSRDDDPDEEDALDEDEFGDEEEPEPYAPKPQPEGRSEEDDIGKLLYGVPASPEIEMREIHAPQPEDASERTETGAGASASVRTGTQGQKTSASVPEASRKTEQPTDTAGIESDRPEDDWKRRMEQPPRFNLRHVRIPDLPVKQWVRPDDGKKEEEQAGALRRSQEKDLSLDDFESDEADFRSERPAGEPEGAKRRLRNEESSLSKMLERVSGLFGTKRKSAAARNPEDKQPIAEDESVQPADTADENPQKTTEAEEPQPEMKPAVSWQNGNQPEMRPAVSWQDGTQPDGERAHLAEGGEASAADQTPAAMPRSIEVVNLNENANHKQVEVIDLDGSKTGPLPDLSAADSGSRRTQEGGRRFLKEARRNSGGFLDGLSGRLSGLRAGKSRQGKNQASVSEILGTDPRTELASAKAAGMRETTPQARKKRGLIMAGFLAAGILLAVLLIFWAAGSGTDGSASSSGSGITADEGLTVRIRRQPTSYTTSGDVTLSVRAPKTIQSITVNGDAVKFSGDKKTDITVQAATGTLKLMVVSTDKVRNATVKLAYVDAEPPVVTVHESAGKVTLEATDDSSGVAGIYYGVTGPASDVPLYQAYTQPFEEEKNQVYWWYAVDKAGNMTAPVSGTFTEAESLSFSKKSYFVTPGSSMTIHADVRPKNAYVNHLTYTSSDEKVFRIDQGNIIVPVSEGKAKVTASADGLPDTTAEITVSDAKTVTITAVGDCTLGTDPSLAADTSFPAFQAVHGDSYFFQNVRDILSQDDLTIANFEGTLTTSDQRANKKFTFKGDPAYTAILKDGSIEAVTLANNHTMDYGEQGLKDTEDALTGAGIAWCSGNDIAYQELNGVKCAFIGIYAVENGLESLDQLKSAVKQAKVENAQLVVVDFHWNSELVEEPNEDMVTLGHAAVDAGADLVVGSHSHIVSGIEKYNGKFIVYGLGNFCFGGNLHPRDMDAMMFRQTFTVTGDGAQKDDNIAIIPVCVSSDSSYNNYQPTPVSGSAADQIMQKIDARSRQFETTWDSYMKEAS
ncbi:CapA family protein [Porcincola intestinalis]|uniref:CapA family protein n=1 Tax=Porcincola intestinalis TaxID=2606632 RepID=UPI002A7EFE61|nr:CapA family protein [Porcincola intestinalis]MDY4204530.1 CapA family protein [Porcincola intestinalis]